MKKIVYIGHKEIKADNVAQTGVVWTRGQVQEIVDDKKAEVLLKHPLIWKDADGKKPEEIQELLLPELAAVAPEPRVSIIPQGDTSPYWEPVVVPVPADVFTKLQTKDLVAVFMTSEDADAFAEWKLERDTRPSAPQKTGPKPQAKETKPGLDAAPKKAAA